MNQSRRTQIQVVIILAILTVGITVSVVYFSPPPQIQTQTPLNVEINLIGEIDTGGSALRVHVEGDLAFVIDYGDNSSHGLVIVNVSNPSQPEILGSYHNGGLPFAIESVGDIVYIAD